MKKTVFRRARFAAGIMLCASIFLGLTGCQFALPSRPSEPIQRTDFILNTFVDIKIYDSRDTSILDDAMALCKDYEAQFSRTMEGSEIYKLNHRPSGEETIQLSRPSITAKFPMEPLTLP